jgi:hypothetical protein
MKRSSGGFVGNGGRDRSGTIVNGGEKFARIAVATGVLGSNLDSVDAVHVVATASTVSRAALDGSDIVLNAIPYRAVGLDSRDHVIGPDRSFGAVGGPNDENSHLVSLRPRSDFDLVN